MEPTEDAYAALARSSPWRWRSLHLHARSDLWDVEAWVVRPGWLRVRDRHGDDRVVDQRREPRPAAGPTYRPDGLVAERPLAVPHDAFDDPMHQSYAWVAMLDPAELGAGVELTDLERTERHGRDTWWATCRAEADYEARCPDCCDLLAGGYAERLAHRVGLDVQTGVVVSLRALEGERAWWLDNRLLAVDEDVVVPGPRAVAPFA